MIDFLNIVINNCMRVCFIGVIAGIVFAYLPASLFKGTEKLLKTLDFEENGRFYEKYFKISRWKDKLPQFSNIVKVGFHLNNLEIKSKEYFERFRIETLRAEVTHLFLIIISPVFFFWNENKIYGVICTILYIIGNFPFLMIQRYNRPRIEKIEKMMDERKNKKWVFKRKTKKNGVKLSFYSICFIFSKNMLDKMFWLYYNYAVIWKRFI